MKKRPVCYTRPVRNIALAAASAFAISTFAAGAAFASTTPGSTTLVPSVGTVPSGLTTLDHGGLPVTASLPALGGGGLTGAASGLGLLSAVPLLGSLGGAAAPVTTHQSAPASRKPAKPGVNGKRGRKALTPAHNTVGSTGSGSPVAGGVSGASGALPNVGGITGLLKGIPLTSLLGSVK